MAALNRGFGTGGYSFGDDFGEPARSASVRSSQGSARQPQNSYRQPPQRPRSAPPARQSRYIEPDDFDNDLDDGFDDDFDDFGSKPSFRPSPKKSAIASSAVDTAQSYMNRYSKLYRDEDDDDDYEDERRQRRPEQRPEQRQRSEGRGGAPVTAKKGRFSDDLFEEDDMFDEMYGPRRRPQQNRSRDDRDGYDDAPRRRPPRDDGYDDAPRRRPQQSIDRDGYDDEPRRRPPRDDDYRDDRPQRSRAPRRDEFDDDDYYGGGSLSDNGNQGGVPAVFANYFKDDDDGFSEARSKKNKSTTRAQRRKRNIILATSGIAAAFACVFALVYYLSSIKVNQPLTVTSSLAALDAQSAYSMLRYSVDDELATKQYTISLDGVTSAFRLSDYGFCLASPTEGKKDRFIEVSGADGETLTQTIATKGNFSFNETLIKNYLDKAAVSKGGTPMVEPAYSIKGDQLTITDGTDGYGINYEHFMEELVKRISSDSADPIECTMQENIAPEVDIDKIYSEVKCFASDAYSTTDAAGNKEYVEDVVGKDFDLESARSQIAAGGKSWTIKLTLTQPSLSLKELRAPDCPDLLAEFSTKFNATNKARATNLALAASKINGLVMQPGDEFSYNETVGERTPERGFCKATVYSGEGTDEDYGGGICQTSSTLYYTCIMCNLEILERTNHRYTVHYQDAGTDATVSWGTYDYKFKNNKEYPIKLTFNVKGGTITCRIYGTEDGIKAYFGFLEMEVYNWTTVYKKPAPGKKDQAPQLGKKVKTYRIVTKDGEKISKEVENVDTYLPLNKVVYTGSLPPGASYS